MSLDGRKQEVDVVSTTDVRNLAQKLADDGRLFISSTNKQSLVGNNGEEISLALVKNPTSSGRVVRIGKVIFNIAENNSFSIILRVYHNPTITANGTALAVLNQIIVGGDSPVSEVFLSPTISANGTFRSAFGATHQAPFKINFDFTVELLEGNTMLITAEKNSGSAPNVMGDIILGEIDI